MSHLVCGLPRNMATAIWSPEFHKIFLDLCMEQTLAGNKSGKVFNQDGWTNILASFNKKTGSRCDKILLMNHWYIIRKQWKIWRKLTGCDYMKWDPETNAFGASNDDWVNYLVENPNAAEYRSSPLPHIEMLEIIFANDNADDEDDEVQAQGKRLSRHHDNESRFDDEEQEQSMSKSSSHRSKSFWTPQLHELFVDLCLQETLDGDKPGISRHGWKNILETFNEKTGMGYTRFHLKNHWDSTRKQWKMWCKLICTSSMKWDPDTCTFGATDKEWESYIHANSKAAPFRHKPIPYADKLEIIFGGLILSRDTDPAPRRRKLNDHSSLSPFYAEDEPMPVSPLYVYEPARASTARKTARRSSRKRRNSLSTPSHTLVDEPRSNTLAQKSPAGVESEQGKPSYSIGECIKCLDGMEEVEAGSDLYLFALDMFLKKEYREIFLQLKSPGLRVAWLQRLQMFGPCLN